MRSARLRFRLHLSAHPAGDRPQRREPNAARAGGREALARSERVARVRQIV